MSSGRIRVGQIGERIAARHLKIKKHEILDRNFTTRVGEIDIVSSTAGTLVFTEVKTRRVTTDFIDLDSYGVNPVESVTATKQQRIRKAAHTWIDSFETKLKFQTVRFDTIGVIIDGRDRLLSLEHLEAAF